MKKILITLFCSIVFSGCIVETPDLYKFAICNDSSHSFTLTMDKRCLSGPGFHKSLMQDGQTIQVDGKGYLLLGTFEDLTVGAHYVEARDELTYIFDETETIKLDSTIMLLENDIRDLNSWVQGAFKPKTYTFTEADYERLKALAEQNNE